MSCLLGLRFHPHHLERDPAHFGEEGADRHFLAPVDELGLRDETHKLIVKIKPGGDTFQLYEISTDPGERLDRAAQEPARAANAG